MLLPTTENVVLVVDLTIVRAGDCVAGTKIETAGDTVVPDVAAAVFATFPASMSACVVV